jgi:hypothetical protein
MTHTVTATVAAAEAAFYGHRHYRYRGCAPHWDPDHRGMVLGDETVPLDAFSASSEDGGEAQKDRIAREKRALAVCAGCPILTECRTYANTELPDGHLVQPDGIWGGQLALTRHRALIARRTAVPAGPTERELAEARTVQKQQVLAALARNTDDELVAYRAGMDLRTANWHRSNLCSLLGLDKETATRAQLLHAAAKHGVLPKGVRAVPDGRWPIAAAPTTDGARQRRIAAGAPQQLTLALWPDGHPAPQAPAGGPKPRHTPHAAGSRPRRLRIVHTWVAEPLPALTPARTLGAAA